MFRYREFSPIHDHDASQNQIEKIGARPDWLPIVTAISCDRTSFKRNLSCH